MRALLHWKRWVGGGTLLMMLMGLIVWAVWPRERLLLNLATCIGDATDFAGWASNHEFVRFKRVWPIDATHLPTITRCDIRTGQERSFPVTKADPRNHSIVLPSPDGRWVLCWNAAGPEPGDSVTALNLQTGASVSWPSVGDAYHGDNLWMPDNHHWLRLTTDSPTLLDVDAPQKSIKLLLPHDYPGDHAEFLTTSDHLFVEGIPSDGVKPMLREYALLPHLHLLRSIHLNPPSGPGYVPPEFSLEGDRIV